METMDERVLRVGAYLHIQGDGFSPSRAEERLGIRFGPRKNEPGDLGLCGRYLGAPVPYGSADWELLWGDEPEEFLPLSLELFRIPKLVDVLRESGATEIVLYVSVGYDGQCNMELSPALLAAIAKLSVPLAISVYELEAAG